MPRRRLCTLRAVLSTAMAALAALAIVAGPAAADPPASTDAFPCLPVGWDWRCPLTQNKVPVYATPTVGSEQIGWLWVRGAEPKKYNSFVHQVEGEIYSKPGKSSVKNQWWGFTQADKAGRKPGDSGWGYVPEVYFKGGDNFESDRALPISPASRCGADLHFC